MDQAVVDQAVSSGRGWGLADRLKTLWSQADTTRKEKIVPEG